MGHVHGRRLVVQAVMLGLAVASAGHLDGLARQVTWRSPAPIGAARRAAGARRGKDAG